MKKISLEVSDGKEKVELSKETYDLLAIAMLEDFVSGIIENNDVLGVENK